jgi:predicted GH43/DUF377 family glycosyl hydrolase
VIVISVPGDKMKILSSRLVGLFLVMCLFGFKDSPVSDFKHVLSCGAPGEWDYNGVYGPVVFKENDVWYMIYTGSDKGIDLGDMAFGLATSTDGITWTKYKNNPVFRKTGTWDHVICSTTSIVKVDGEWFLYYTGSGTNYSHIGLIKSKDLIHWEEAMKNPISFHKKDPDGWDGYGESFPSVFKDGDQFVMYFMGADKKTMAYGHGLAFSKDGKDWIEYEKNPLFVKGDSVDAVNAPANCSITKYKDYYLDAYEAQGAVPEIPTHVPFIHICLAYSKDATTFKKYKEVFVGGEHIGIPRANVWSPGLFNDSGKLLLFFGYSDTESTKNGIGVVKVNNLENFLD